LLEKGSNGDCFGYGNESVGSVFAGGAAAAATVVFPAGAPYAVGQAAESKGCCDWAQALGNRSLLVGSPFSTRMAHMHMSQLLPERDVRVKSALALIATAKLSLQYLAPAPTTDISLRPCRASRNQLGPGTHFGRSRSHPSHAIVLKFAKLIGPRRRCSRPAACNCRSSDDHRKRCQFD
jgi:hypothetical protein